MQDQWLLVQGHYLLIPLSCITSVLREVMSLRADLVI